MRNAHCRPGSVGPRVTAAEMAAVPVIPAVAWLPQEALAVLGVGVRMGTVVIAAAAGQPGQAHETEQPEQAPVEPFLLLPYGDGTNAGSVLCHAHPRQRGQKREAQDTHANRFAESSIDHGELSCQGDQSAPDPQHKRRLRIPAQMPERKWPERWLGGSNNDAECSKISVKLTSTTKIGSRGVRLGTTSPAGRLPGG